jgi:hypothetical protein
MFRRARLGIFSTVAASGGAAWSQREGPALAIVLGRPLHRTLLPLDHYALDLHRGISMPLLLDFHPRAQGGADEAEPFYP